jgi:hypothetical protein
MKRFLVFLALLPGLAYGQAARIETTKGQYTLSRMFRQGGVGWPGFAADPFACGAASDGTSYYNTTSKKNMTCNGTAWEVSGGVTSPIAGDFVVTGKWEWAVSSGAANGVAIGETAGAVTFEGVTGGADAFETRLSATDPTADRSISLPDASGTVSLLSTPLRIYLSDAGGSVWTNMPLALTFFLGLSRGTQLVDLSGYTQVRFHVHRTATAATATSKVILLYKATSFSGVVTDYADIGTSEVSVVVELASVYSVTNWVPLVAGAKAAAGVWVTVAGSGGDGAVDPTFGVVLAEFK